MMQTIPKLRPGDLVEVMAPDEILQTLDADGTLDQLPFMPEMIEFCGRRFRVSKRVLKTCYYGTSSGMRKFGNEDVVLLEGLRCSGDAHDGCQKACMIFWREAWLRRAEEAAVQPRSDLAARERLRSRLKTSRGPNTYFCQASEILKATDRLSRWERFEKCFDEVRMGNYSLSEMAQRIGRWLFWRLRRVLLGEYAHGNNKSTPAENLNLRPGELVEIKSIEGINKTLNENGYNRGLYFTPDMRLLCGKQHRVQRRIEKIIVDGTGEMRKLGNTVYLEGELCGCVYALGGCPRGEFSYWREIWLRRAQAPVAPEVENETQSEQEGLPAVR